MQYVHLGRSGLRVSRLCLGTMNFGPHHRSRRWSDHGSRARVGHQFLRQRQCVWLEEVGEGSRNKLSADGWLRGRSARRSCWPPRCTDGWATGPTSHASRRGTSNKRVKAVCGA